MYGGADFGSRAANSITSRNVRYQTYACMPTPYSVKSWNKIRVSAHKHLNIATIVVSVVKHLYGNCHVRALFLDPVIEAIASIIAGADPALKPLPFVTSNDCLQKRKCFQRSKIILLARLGRATGPSGKVVDALNLIVLAKARKKSLDVQPLVRRATKRPVVEIEPINVND